MMFEAAVSEFPFVAEMPKREKSKLVKVWEHFRELSALADKEGMLIPMSYAAVVLDVCRQRVYQLAETGQLKVIEVNGHSFVTEKSVIEFAESERKAGRPAGRLGPVMDGKQTPLGASVEFVREVGKARKRAKNSQK
jgi:hypothetical protein